MIKIIFFATVVVFGAINSIDAAYSYQRHRERSLGAYPLFEAVLDGRFNDAKRMIEAGANVTQETGQEQRFPGENIFHVLVRVNNNEDAVMDFFYWLQQRVTQETFLGLLNKPNGEGLSSLLIAVLRGNFALAQAMIRVGADITAVTGAEDRFPGRNIFSILASSSHVPELAAVTFFHWLQQNIAQRCVFSLLNQSSRLGIFPLHAALFGGKFNLVHAMINAGADVTVVTGAEDRFLRRNVFMIMLRSVPDVNDERWDRLISAVRGHNFEAFGRMWERAIEYENNELGCDLLRHKNLSNISGFMPPLPPIIGPSRPANSGNNQVVAQEVSTAYSLSSAVRLPQGVVGIYPPIIGNSPQLSSYNQALRNRSLPTKAVPAAVNQPFAVKESPMERIFHAVLDFRLEDACRIITTDPTAMTKVTVPPNRYPGQNIIHLLLSRCKDQIQGEGREDEAVKFLNFLNEQNHQGLLNLMNALNSGNVAPLHIAVLRGHFKLAEAMIFAGVDVTTRAGGLDKHSDRNIFMLMLDLYPDVNGNHKVFWDRIISAIYFKNRNDFDKIWSQAVQYENVKLQRNLLEEKNITAFTQNVFEQNFSIPSLPPIIGPSRPANSGNNQVAAQEVFTAYSLSSAVRLPQGVVGLYPPIIGNSPSLLSLNQDQRNRLSNSIAGSSALTAVNQPSPVVGQYCPAGSENNQFTNLQTSFASLPPLLDAVIRGNFDQAKELVNGRNADLTEVTGSRHQYPGLNIFHLLAHTRNTEAAALDFFSWLQQNVSPETILHLLNQPNNENSTSLLPVLLTGKFYLAEAMINAGADVAIIAGDEPRYPLRNIFMVMLRVLADVNDVHWDRIISVVYKSNFKKFWQEWKRAIEYENNILCCDKLRHKNLEHLLGVTIKFVDAQRRSRYRHNPYFAG